MRKNVKEKGITIVALVVTVIILLILAGVTIAQLSGENGLFSRIKEAVEKYKNASEQEEVQLGELEKYVSDFSIVGGDGEGGDIETPGEEKVLVNITGLEVLGEANTITVTLRVEGEANIIEYSIDNGNNWAQNAEEGEEIEEGQKQYKYVFNELALGKSYFVRVKVYDINGKYIEAISNIVTLSYTMTAQEVDVLQNKTYLTEDGTLRTGQMPNNGAVTPDALSAGGSYTIPKGYHDGKGKVTAKSLADQTKATATKEQILKDKTAWVNGIQITGTMPDNGAINQTLSAGGSYEIPKGYTSGGKITVKGLSDQTTGTATAEQILKDKTAWVNGVQITGTMTNNGAINHTNLAAGSSYTIPKGYHDGKGKVTAKSLADQTSGTAIASQILKNQTAWVNGVQITGTMENKGAVTSSLNAGGTYTIPAGYHNGNGKVTAKSLADQTVGNAISDNITSGKIAWVNGQRITGNGKDIDAAKKEVCDDVYQALKDKSIIPNSNSLDDILKSISDMSSDNSYVMEVATLNNGGTGATIVVLFPNSSGRTFKYTDLNGSGTGYVNDYIEITYGRDGYKWRMDIRKDCKINGVEARVGDRFIWGYDEFVRYIFT